MDSQSCYILFDIDGTLVASGGVGRKAMVAAMDELYDWPEAFDNLRFDGRTDLSILSMTFAQRPELKWSHDQVFETYLKHLRHFASNLDESAILPGVVPLLGHLEQRSDIRLGLLTGNLKRGAQQKLASVGLWERFEFGAYGDDAEIRSDLVPIALERAGGTLESNTIIFGDTPDDIVAGRTHKVPVIAVATGSSFEIADLETCDPRADYVLEDLSDTKAVLDLIERLRSID